MKRTFTQWLSLLLVTCMLCSVAVPALAANGTATLSSTTMTESGSITVTFSQTATSSKYYNIQIADSSWSTTYVNTDITSGTTYTISGYSAGTYQIYIGYWEDGSWKSDALSTTTFTVTADGAGAASGYTVSLALSNSSGASTADGLLTTGATDTVTATVTLYQNGTEIDVPNGMHLSVWYENKGSTVDMDKSDGLVEISLASQAKTTTITVDTTNFTAGNTYNVYAALYENGKTEMLTDDYARASFTVNAKYTLSVKLDDTSSTSTDSIITSFGSQITAEAIISVYNISEKTSSTVTTIPDGCRLTIWYQYDDTDNGSDGDTVFDYKNALYASMCDDDDNKDRSGTITVYSDGTVTGAEGVSFTAGKYYTVYAGLYDANGDLISYNGDGENAAAYATFLVPAETDCSFMRGMDLSTFYTNWTNGAVYYDYDGNEYSQSKGNAVKFFQFLYEECGVNWVRLRVWNNPYDSSNNPYGGGNCGLDTAKIIGQWASEAGMSVLIDFHYSDFWADPGRQLAPKAWSSMTIGEKSEALYTYTYNSLATLLKAGVNVSMVQIGNETNGSFCGEIVDWSQYNDSNPYKDSTVWENICTLFNKGYEAVQAVKAAYPDKDIQVALHFAFTSANGGDPAWYAELLDYKNVYYDVMGISYYMYNDGTIANLVDQMETIKTTYGKDAFIAETACPYTTDNADNLENGFTAINKYYSYDFSAEGQMAALTDILTAAVTTDGCIGMFYWEPAWTVTNTEAYRDAGGGWATKFVNDYLTDYNITTSEGSSFDNQTLFDSYGKALKALAFFKEFFTNNEVSANTCVVNHTWNGGEITRQATADEDGIITYTCSVCGDTRIEFFEVDQKYSTIYARTLMLDGSIGVNFYVDMTGVTNPEEYTMSFTVDGVTSTAFYNADSYRIIENTKCYRFTVYLDSTQMAETITVKLLCGDLTVDTDEYSVKTYCDKAIKNDWNAKYVCAALLNYGGYAQTNFGKYTNTMANENLATLYAYTEKEIWSNPVDDWKDSYVSSFRAEVSDVLPREIEADSDGNHFAMTLLLESQTTIRIYFNLTNGSSEMSLTFKLGDDVLAIHETQSSDSGYGTYSYYIEFKVQASKLSQTHTVNVSNESGVEGTLSYSVYAYVNAMVVKEDSNASDNLKNVCKALYFYGQAAERYKDWYTGNT